MRFSRPAVANLILAYASLFYYGLCDNVRGPIYPEILKSFDLSQSQGTWFFAVSSIISIASGFFAPACFRRLGYLNALRLAVFGMCLSQWILAFAPQFLWVLIGSFCFGMTVGLITILQSVLVMVAVPAEQAGRWLNGLQANYAGSSLLAPLLFTGLWNLHPQFQLSFWFTGVLGILLFVATLFVPELLEPKTERGPVAAGDRVTPEMLLMAGVLSAYLIAEILMDSRLALFSRLYLKGNAQAAGLLTALFFVGLFVSRFVFTFLDLKSSPRRQLQIGLGLALIFSLMGIFVSPWNFLIVGLAMGPCYALAMALVRELFPKQLEKATTTAVVGSGIAAVMVHFGAGWLVQFTDVRWMMLLAPAACGFALILLLLHEVRHG